MAEATIPVDLFNPGQVFACLGLVEAAEILLGDAEGAFDWSNEADVRFHLRAAGEENPVAKVLGFLGEADVRSVAPYGSDHRTEKWGVPTRLLTAGEPFPFPEPESPATLPAILSAGEVSISLDYWGDGTSRDNTKFWAGAGGYPGAALARDALGLLREHTTRALADPFAMALRQTSSFRLDWRRDYVPMDVGFSPNEHGDITMVGYPMVEILAAIGLSNARPRFSEKLAYSYAVLGRNGNDEFFAPMFLRAALGCAPLPFYQRRFRMRLVWPGRENQARCIVDVTEEAIP